MIAVDEVDVGIAGRTERDRSAGGVASSGVGGGIVFSEVSLDLDDTGRKTGSAFAHQDFSEEVASDTTWIAGVESARKWMDGGRGHGIGIRMQRLRGKSQKCARINGPG